MAHNTRTPYGQAFLAVAAVLLGARTAKAENPFASSLKAPFSLTYSVTIEDIRSPELLAQEKLRVVAPSKTKEGVLKHLDPQKPKGRIRKITVTVGAKDSKLLLKQSEDGVDSVSIIDDEMTMLRNSNGDVLAIKGVDSKNIPFIPYVCGVLSGYRQFARLDPNGADNGDHAELGLVIHNPAIPVSGDTGTLDNCVGVEYGKDYDRNAGTGTLTVGLSWAPLSKIQVLSTRSVGGTPVVSKYVETSYVGRSDTLRPVTRTTVELDKATAELTDRDFEMASYVKNGDNVQYEGAHSFNYDPAGGSLEAQAKKMVNAEKAGKADEKAAQSGQRLILVALIALVTVVGLALILRRGRK